MNASRLFNLDLDVDLDENNFSGSVPVDLGKLGGLEWLTVEGNQLGTRGDANSNDLDIITSLNNFSNLEPLDIDSNQFGGMLPNSVANLSTQLSMLMMSGNPIYGSIPESIYKPGWFDSGSSRKKKFPTSHVPATIRRLQNLQILSLFDNSYQDKIPSSDLNQLDDLRLTDNDIQGIIPPTLGNCTKQFLDLSQNKLNGTIPEEVISICSLSIYLSLSSNSLVVSLTREIAHLKTLVIVRAWYLQMQDNLFSGSTPPTLSKLKGVE